MNLFKTFPKNKISLLYVGIVYLFLVSAFQYVKCENVFAVALSPISVKHKFVYSIYVLFINYIWIGSFYLIYTGSVATKNSVVEKFLRCIYFFAITIGLLFTIVNTEVFIVNGTHLFDDYVLSAFSSNNFLREVYIPPDLFLKAGLLIVSTCILPYALFWFFKRINVAYCPKILVWILILIPFVLFVFLKNRWQLREIQRTLPEKYISGLLIKKDNIFDESYLAPYTKSINQYKHTLSKIENHKIKNSTILIIHIESLRQDFANEKYMPYLSSLLSKSTIKSQHSYSSANTTELNVFSLLYGINSAAFERFQEDSVLSIPLQLLRKSGYGLYGYSASNLKNWLHAGFIFKNFDSYKEFISETPYNDDSVMIENLRKEYQLRDHTKPALYYTFLVSTHHNYYFPPSFEKYKPVADKDQEIYADGHYSKEIKQKVLNRYKNSVTYADYNVKKILTIFKKQFDDNNLIVVITGDHGEEFWDFGMVGHAANHLYNCRTTVPLFFYLPNQNERKLRVSSNTEIMPTIFDYLGIDDDSVCAFFDYQSLLKPIQDSSKRFIVVSGCDFKNQRKACIVSDKCKEWVTVNERTILMDRSFSLNDSSMLIKTKGFLVRNQLKKTIDLCNRYLAH